VQPELASILLKRAAAVGALAAAAAVTAALAGPWSGGVEPRDAPARAAACRVTIPNGSKPPGESFEAHGNGRLWAVIPPDGRIVARPRGSDGLPHQGSDGSIVDKVLWLGRRTSRTRSAKLKIAGTRLDADARTFRLNRGRGSWNGEALYWPGYMKFPAAGCWKVVGTLGKGTRLAFVLSVEPPPR
jgi:hypothetical protein